MGRAGPTATVSGGTGTRQEAIVGRQRLRMAAAVALVVAAGVLGACIPPQGSPPVVAPRLVATAAHQQGTYSCEGASDPSMVHCNGLLVVTVTNEGTAMTRPGVRVTPRIDQSGSDWGTLEPDTTCDEATLLGAGQSCVAKLPLHRLAPYAQVMAEQVGFTGTVSAVSAHGNVRVPFAFGPKILGVVAEPIAPPVVCTPTATGRTCDVRVRITATVPVGSEAGFIGLEVEAVEPATTTFEPGCFGAPIPGGSSCTTERTIRIVDAGTPDATATFGVRARDVGLALVGATSLTVALPAPI